MAEDGGWLAAHRVQLVVTCAAGCQPAVLPEGVVGEYLPLTKQVESLQAVASQLRRGILPLVREVCGRGAGVLFHCERGRNRSVACVCLMALYMGIRLGEAEWYIIAMVGKANVRDSFQRVLCQWETSLFGGGSTWPGERARDVAAKKALYRSMQWLHREEVPSGSRVLLRGLLLSDARTVLTLFVGCCCLTHCSNTLRMLLLCDPLF